MLLYKCFIFIEIRPKLLIIFVMRFIEKTAVLLALIGLAFRLLFIAGGAVMLVFAILVLSIVYLFFGFALFNRLELSTIFRKSAYAAIPSVRIVGAIVAGCAVTLACLGILFALMLWEGYTAILTVSSTLCLGSIVISMVLRRGENDPFFRRILARTLPATAICLLLLFTPRIAYLKVMYRNHPAYIEALEQLRKDPSNQHLRDKVEEEWKKTGGNDNQRLRQ
jgi:hypothetical protein